MLNAECCFCIVFSIRTHSSDQSWQEASLDSDLPDGMAGAAVNVPQEGNTRDCHVFPFQGG